MVVTCRSCEGRDFYLQKDFPRKIAVGLVLAGALTVPWTYGLSLVLVALVDFLLFRLVHWMTVCYRCRSEYRAFRRNPAHQEFDRHLDELYRYRGDSPT